MSGDRCIFIIRPKQNGLIIRKIHTKHVLIMFNPKFIHSIKLKFLVFSTAFFMAAETSANAQQTIPTLTPRQAQNLSRDLLQSSSQDFFRQGNNAFEREIQLLRERPLSSNKPILKIELMQIQKRPSTQEKP